VHSVLEKNGMYIPTAVSDVSGQFLTVVRDIVHFAIADSISQKGSENIQVER
jgi:hypothetical protein